MNFRGPLLLALAAVNLAGCRSDDGHAYMPLEIGQRSEYMTKAGYPTYFEPLEVVGRVPIEGGEGYLLDGGMGPTRMGWIGDTLCVSQTAGVVVSPPLPILTPLGPPRKWHGRTEWRGETLPSGATIETTSVELMKESRKIETRLGTVNLTVGGKPITLKTWFERGVGIVAQEQTFGRDQSFSLSRIRSLPPLREGSQ